LVEKGCNFAVVSNNDEGQLRSPVVIRSVEDYLAGQLQPDGFLAGLMAVQQNVAAVMANVGLV
jgi:hypothetical protein